MLCEWESEQINNFYYALEYQWALQIIILSVGMELGMEVVAIIMVVRMI